MNLTSYMLLAVLLLGTALLYLRLARYFKLIDKPNERSSHTDLTTVRAGGILFYVAVLGAMLVGRFDQPYFFAGLTGVALVSFLDDLFQLAKRYRIMSHVVSVGLLLAQINFFPDWWWAFAGLMIVGVGFLNMYNFMDGINGMTAFYSIVTIGTLWYWFASQDGQIPETELSSLFPSVLIALLIFSYLNARRQAICFAGDVGSISMGFIILYALLRLIISQRTILPVLLLSVYGVDSGLTIAYRLYLRQNIVQAHRLHLFQRLVHQLKWPHLRVSALYASVQLSINGLVLMAIDWSATAQLRLAGLILGSLSIVYIVLTRRLVRQQKWRKVSSPTPFLLPSKTR